MEDCGTDTIIGGDFNICLNPDLDKYGGRKEPQSLYGSVIDTFMVENDFVDVWWLLNPDVR